ncbi:putative efflux pump antibiotic resistance protein [Massariosphaeria phaeospora]|uniref:Putative efflux pump antibiotic resistance protein n=1 Tax=Massariosphaeria phaeospora TaxID=100035 RepID=A0A7C8M1T2_9PLEO|nr:putative efflux pump antibiotic resistance protein [Massariosphaeria phaeospora]
MDAFLPQESTQQQHATRAASEKDHATTPQAWNDGDHAIHTERALKGISWIVVVVAVLSSTFLYALDNTIMANVRPSIIDTFGHVDMLPWLSVSYPMGEVGANPLWGKLNDQFNSKLLYLAAVFIFEIGSAVIGSAQSMQAVIIGRAVAGFGGSGIYVGTVNIISAMTTPAERTQYLNFIGMSWSLGTVLGPIVGGAFADSEATWRWAFYINICIAAFSVPACIWLVPPMIHTTPYSLIERIKRLDYLLFLGAVASIVMQGLHLLTVDRIFPAQFAINAEMVNLFSWNAIAIANIVVTIYSLPLFFQFTYGDSSLRAAVYTLPFIFSVVASAGAGGPIFSAYPIYMPWFAGASVLMLIGNGLLSTINYETSRGAICGYTVIQGIGVGPVIQLAYTVGQTKVSRSMIPQVTAFLTCAQMAGLALSLGIATSVFLNCASNDIAIILPGATRSFIQASINGARTGLLQNLTPDDRLRVLYAIARNVGKVFYMNVAGAALGFLSALAMKREKLAL